MQRRQFITLALSLISGVALAAPLKGAVYSPAAGIVCDKKAQFCVDAEGISLAYTKQYMGDKAEQKTQDRINSAGAVGYDTTWFTFSNGVDCKTKEKVCHVSKFSDKVDTAHTKALFGK